MVIQKPPFKRSQNRVFLRNHHFQDLGIACFYQGTTIVCSTFHSKRVFLPIRLFSMVYRGIMSFCGSTMDSE